jgi:hypothetical protein
LLAIHVAMCYLDRANSVHRFLRLMVPLLWGVAPRSVQQSLVTAVIVEV